MNEAVAPSPRITHETREAVRRAVGTVISSTSALLRDPVLAENVSERMLAISLAAADLIAEERRLSEQISERARQRERPLARAQAAGDIHQRTAVSSAPDVLRRTRDAIDFPGFVTSLISGVFQSIQTSSIQQLQAFADLLDAVSSSTSDFASSQISAERAAQWAVNRFQSFATEGSGPDIALVLRDDAELPEASELARSLDASEDEVSSVDDSDLTETLLPLVRRKLARDRQSMLSTMLLMGLQRVVVDDGALHASMQLQVDARSTAEQTTSERSDVRVETEASGSFGVGLWGASAKLAASVGYVHSDEQYSREDLAVTAGLRSSVDVRFRTVPMDMRRMANDRTLDQIRSQSMVPQTEHELVPGGLIAQAPPRSTAAPSAAATPAAPGSLLSQDHGTEAAARTAREAAARGTSPATPGAPSRDAATPSAPARDAVTPSPPPSAATPSAPARDAVTPSPPPSTATPSAPARDAVTPSPPPSTATPPRPNPPAAAIGAVRHAPAGQWNTAAFMSAPLERMRST